MEIKLSDIIKESGKRAGLSEEFLKDFIKRLANSPDIQKEYIYYLSKGAFLCEYQINGVYLSDVIVYQIDHFKAAMDQDRLDMKFNPDKMLLMAIDTMLKMENDALMAENIRNRIYNESGTDGTESGTKRV